MPYFFPFPQSCLLEKWLTAVVLLTLPRGEGRVDVETFNAALSLQYFQLFGWAVVVKNSTLADVGQGREGSKCDTMSCWDLWTTLRAAC